MLEKVLDILSQVLRSVFFPILSLALLYTFCNLLAILQVLTIHLAFPSWTFQTLEFVGA